MGALYHSIIIIKIAYILICLLIYKNRVKLMFLINFTLFQFTLFLQTLFAYYNDNILLYTNTAKIV